MNPTEPELVSVVELLFSAFLWLSNQRHNSAYYPFQWFHSCQNKMGHICGEEEEKNASV